MKEINDFIKKCDADLQELYSERHRIEEEMHEHQDIDKKLKIAGLYVGIKACIKEVKKIKYEAINLRSDEFENSSFDSEVSTAVVNTVKLEGEEAFLRDVDPEGYYNMKLSYLEHRLARVHNVEI